MRIYCLNGIGSTLSCDVDTYDTSDGDYVVGLAALSTFNSIPNIEKGINDKFYYGQDNKEITISTGTYEIEDIEGYLKESMGPNVEFSLLANNNTLKTEIKCSEVINFNKDHTIASLLGFSRTLLKADEKHESEFTVNIIKVDTIRVECNLARGSYVNGIEGHVIHEFYPMVPPGYKMVEVPSPIIYLPLNCQRINNVSIALKDQDDRPINLREESLAVRLYVRKFNGSGIY